MSSLLNEIITETIYENSDINVIMRKLLFLSYKLENDSFKEWVINEVTGYAYTDNDVPFYRYANVNLKGEFRNRNGDISHLTLDPILYLNNDISRDTTNLFYPPKVLTGIAGIKHAITEGKYHQHLFGDATLIYCRLSRADKLECMDVYQEFPIGRLESILECIRFQILKITLELEQNIPNINEILSSRPIENEEKTIVNSIINTTIIHGNNNDVAVKSNNKNQSTHIYAAAQVIDDLINQLLALKQECQNGKIIDEIIPALEDVKNSNREDQPNKFIKILGLASDSSTVLSALLEAFSKLL